MTARSDPSAPVDPWPGSERRAWSVVVASIAAVVAGVIWPEVAGPLLRVALVAAVVGAVVVLAERLLRPMREARDPRSPFDRRTTPRPPAEAPSGLRRIETSLEVDRATWQGRTAAAIPFAIEGKVRSEVARRLYRDHNLQLSRDADHEQIRQLVSPALWTLVGPDPRPVRRGRPVGPARRLPLDHLPRILDDLETL